MGHHVLVKPDSGSLVHLEVGDTLELRLAHVEDATWSLTMLPYGVVPVEDQVRATLRSLVFRAVHGAGGILRFDRTTTAAEVLDVLLTVRAPSRRW